jgi:APA family basic amino acid/polyamine antiporter
MVQHAVSRHRKLGLWMATALVVGNMIGSGVFLLPSSLASFGSISLVGWAITATGAVLLALVFARLGSAFPRTGGPYAYSRRAFGDFIGFQTAWGYWIAAWAGNAAIAVAFVGYLGVFWPGLAGNAVLAAVVAISAIWLLTWVNSLGVHQGGRMQVVTTVIKFLPLLAIAVAGLFWINSARFSPVLASGHGAGDAFHAVTGAAALTLWAFIGLESATVPAEDVKNPEKTIPRSTIIGTLVTAAVYVLGTVAVMGILPIQQLTGSTAPFADAASAVWGTTAGRVVAFGAMTAAFGCLNGWILIQGQVPFAAARDGLFPKQFGKLNRFGAPAFGLWVSSALITGLVFMNYNKSLVDQFTFVILLATLTTLIPYAYSAMAQLMLVVKDRALFNGKTMLRDSLVALGAFVYSFWAITGAGSDVVFKGTMLLLGGIPVYVWLKWRSSNEETGEPETAPPARVLPEEPTFPRRVPVAGRGA